MSKPRLLDAFRGAGGAGMGYHQAGFEVVGIDIHPQKNYPFEFIQGDAIAYIRDHGHEFDAIHASPPCQAYTVLRSVTKGKEYPDLLAATRDALIATGKPWVIENVPGAPMQSGIRLCGTMFNLRVYRHRLFESSHLLMAPDHPRHTVPAVGSHGRDRKRLYQEEGYFATITGNVGSYCGDAMNIDWMTGKELSQAIPPAYTEFVGRQLLSAL